MGREDPSQRAARFPTSSRPGVLQHEGPRISIRRSAGPEEGGGDGTRTHDRLVANQVLYQLSYAPVSGLAPMLPGQPDGGADWT
jgi:hypothetical protein